MRDRGSGKRAREMSRIVVVCWRGRVVSMCLFLRMICGSCWLHISSKLQIVDLEDRKASHRQGPVSCSSTRQLLSSPARPVTRAGAWANGGMLKHRLCVEGLDLDFPRLVRDRIVRHRGVIRSMHHTGLHYGKWGHHKRAGNDAVVNVGLVTGPATEIASAKTCAGW